jgi:hypothetical protein
MAALTALSRVRTRTYTHVLVDEAELDYATLVAV